MWSEFASDSKPPLEAKDQDGIVVADYRYQQIRVFRKENFRCWVVTLDRDGPWESVSYSEEIIPLRENEWVMDIEYDSVTGYPADLLKQRMQNPLVNINTQPHFLKMDFLRCLLTQAKYYSPPCN